MVFSSKIVVGMLTAIILVTATVGLVADQVAKAKDPDGNTSTNDSNLTATDKTLVGLLVLVFILAPVIAIFRSIGDDI